MKIFWNCGHTTGVVFWFLPIVSNVSFPYTQIREKEMTPWLHGFLSPMYLSIVLFVERLLFILIRIQITD